MLPVLLDEAVSRAMVVGIIDSLQQHRRVRHSANIHKKPIRHPCIRELQIQHPHDTDLINVPTPTKTIQCSHKPLYLHLPPYKLHIYAIHKETMVENINFIY